MFAVIAMAMAMGGCDGHDPDRVQGYAEGEFVYVASPLAGALESLHVRRGAQVRSGDALFALDSAPEQAARDQAERRLAQARADLEDARKGRRPTEIESLEAQLAQAKTALALSEKEFTRLADLVESAAGSRLEFDRARSARDQNGQRVAQLEADLKTAALGARPDQIVAAEANVRALEAALARVEWDLAQKSQAAPQAGLVFDTLYREGEWVAAGRPVVALLPPDHIKARAFVPQARIGAVQVGDRVRVSIDGVADPLPGKVSFISPQAEYTPPVIYSQESRSKLVFMIEVTFEPDIAAKLHPGQPLDVNFDGEKK
jgi:HlyD family secretion protein